MRNGVQFRLLLLVLPLLFVSCHTKEIAYISDAQRDSAQDILAVYTATILPGDQLYIYVESKTPESVIPFNQETHRVTLTGSSLEYLDTLRRGVIDQSKSNISSESQQYVAEVEGYFVSEKGTINFPILGQLSVVGITQDSLKHYLEQRLKEDGYVIDPVVTTKLMNFRVTVVGEVRAPQQIHVPGTRLTILEALAICGDITDYGQRENVVIMRDENGQKTLGEVDLTKKEMLDSPYYYLHNNDVVYIEPNDRQKRMSDRNDDIPRYISIAVSVGNIIVTNLNIARRLSQM
ncbi:MAG: polysaccharide biosynthesis/export family protein [Bacteroidales bacterium]|nr:polysaccharide biosynthesis/export family protein [Bacteroidales bacterium]